MIYSKKKKQSKKKRYTPIKKPDVIQSEIKTETSVIW